MKKVSKRKKKINKRGFSKLELLTMLGVLAVLITIGAKLVIDNSKNVSGFKNVANNFANDVSKFKDQYPRTNNIYYLNELITKGFSEELKNPINSNETCDRYNTFVEIINSNTKKVTLNCGNYFVEGIQGTSYRVYEVSEWHDTKEENDNENQLLYNYKKNGQLVLGEYVSDKAFVEWYYVKEKNNITSPYDIENKDGMELLTKNAYRSKKIVKEIK